MEARASESPNLDAFVWYSDELALESSITYGELQQRSLSLAVQLQQRYQTGDRAVLVFPHGVDFIVAFIGCLQAGLIGVPICPPRRRRPDSRVASIVENAEPAVVLSSPEYVEQRHEWCEKIPQLLQPTWYACCQSEATAADWQKPRIANSTIVFLQYTSGTTGDPKGVMVSHGNLQHNALVIQDAIGPHDQRVFWLPMYHDMGLMGGMLQTLFDGSTSHCITPSVFLQRPMSWLQLMTQTGASFSGAPDFAYDLCVTRTTKESRRALDLSKWSVAVSGAESIRPTTLHRFCEAFEPVGFRSETFQPGYGLAEATLVVSHTPRELPPNTLHVDASVMSEHTIELADPQSERSCELAGSGPAGTEQTLAIVKSNTNVPCAEGEIGEIWVHGPFFVRQRAELSSYSRPLCRVSPALQPSATVGPVGRANRLGHCWTCWTS